MICGKRMGIHIIQYSANRFGFAGSGIPVDLCYSDMDGNPLTEEMAHKVAQFGPGLFSKSVKSVGFDTLEAAQAALDAALATV